MIKFIKENKKYFKLLLIMFFVALFFGFLLGDMFPETIKAVILQIEKSDVADNFFSEFLFIFLHNIGIVILIILMHFLLFVPVFILVYNGFMTGAILRYFFLEKGSIVLLKILPHGIFEIFGIILATALSLKLSIKFLDFITRQKTKAYTDFIKKNYKILYYVLALFFIAAIIETILIIYL